MSLDAMLATHDEAALTSLASVGLMRRARRDLEAGKAEVQTRDANAAVVIADGQTVNIDGKGPAKASCTCPATGVCRHILLAVLVLRSEGDGPAAEPGQSAAEELAALDEAALRKFAGADWDKALTHARMSAELAPEHQGQNLSVPLADTDHAVIFLAGQGLAGAVFKGPKSARRRAVAAAALLARAKGGTQALQALSHDAAPADEIAPEFLAEARTCLEDVVTGVFTGGSSLAEDQLFDLSISARTQAAPRLMALLRTVRRHAVQAREGHIAYRDDRFLADAALAYALTTALDAAPGDPDLTGVIRRDYAEAPPMNLYLLGAAIWSAESGARGIRFHLLDPDSGRWMQTGQARAGGMDPNFRPSVAYHAPLWASGRAKAAIGSLLRLQDSRVASDGQIAWDHGRCSTTAVPDLSDTLVDKGLMHVLWSGAFRDLGARQPSRLRSGGRSDPLLLCPTAFGEPGFDDISQVYEITARDRIGQVLSLRFPNTQKPAVVWLHQNPGQCQGLLCEVRDDTIWPITLFRRDAPPLNLTLDHIPAAQGKAVGLLTRARSFFRGAASIKQAPSPILALADASFDAIASEMRRPGTADLAPLRQRAGDMGLTLLTRALADVAAEATPRHSLIASHITAEISRRAALV